MLHKCSDIVGIAVMKNSKILMVKKNYKVSPVGSKNFNLASRYSMQIFIGSVAIGYIQYFHSREFLNFLNTFKMLF